MNKLSPQQESLRLRLHSEGLSTAEIAETIGCPPQTVHSWLRRRGVRPNPSPRRQHKPHKPHKLRTDTGVPLEWGLREYSKDRQDNVRRFLSFVALVKSKGLQGDGLAIMRAFRDGVEDLYREARL